MPSESSLFISVISTSEIVISGQSAEIASDCVLKSSPAILKFLNNSNICKLRELNLFLDK